MCAQMREAGMKTRLFTVMDTAVMSLSIKVRVFEYQISSDVGLSV